MEKQFPDNFKDRIKFNLHNLLAFEYFKRKNVDVAILEVGIGGTLDITNIVDDKILTIITSIG